MLRVKTRKFGYATILCLSGQVVISELDTLRSAVREQLDADSILLDFGHVTRIDASALGLLLELREETQARGIEFKLKNITGFVKTVFEISRLRSVFETSADVDGPQAVPGFRSTAGVMNIVTCVQEV